MNGHQKFEKCIHGEGDFVILKNKILSQSPQPLLPLTFSHDILNYPLIHLIGLDLKGQVFSKDPLYGMKESIKT